VSELRLRQTDLQWRSVEGEVVALDLIGSQYLGVTPSGAALWDMLAGGTSRDALIEHLATTYALERTVAAEHTDAFLDQLRAQDLLEESQ
jgi:Coenzyme PQQ synthesis protein D (PqqD)